MISMLFRLKCIAALASAHMRALSLIYGNGEKRASLIIPRPRPQEPSHPYWDAVDEARAAVFTLADYCVAHSFEITNSPLYSGLEFQQVFEDHVARCRVVICNELTPRAIFDSYTKRHTLKAGGWTLSIGEAIEGTDPYGVPCMTAPLVCTNRNGQSSVLTAPCEPRQLARLAWELCTGLPAIPADDDLGIDPDPYWPRAELAG